MLIIEQRASIIMLIIEQRARIMLIIKQGASVMLIIEQRASIMLISRHVRVDLGRKLGRCFVLFQGWDMRGCPTPLPRFEHDHVFTFAQYAEMLGRVREDTVYFPIMRFVPSYVGVRERRWLVHTRKCTQVE